MEEAGHPPIKIRFKRLTNPAAGSQTQTQQETDCQPFSSASLQSITYKPTRDYPQPIPGYLMGESQTVETMPVDQPSMPGSDIQLHPENHDETRIQGLDTFAEGTAVHRRETGTPDSTTHRSLACDTHESDTGTLGPERHTETDQTHND